MLRARVCPLGARIDGCLSILVYMSDRAARGAAGAAAAHGSGFSPAPEDGRRQQASRNYAWTEFDESRLQGSVTAARLCGGGRVTVDREGIVSIEVRHSHEEPPPVVEKVKQLLSCS